MTQKLDEEHGLLDLDDSLPAKEAHLLIDEAILKREASIRALKFSILALKAQRNMFVPISRRLTPDILHKIFSFVRNGDLDDLAEDDEGNLRWNSLTWIYVTHVCRYWRSVAIDSPSLWAHPPFRNFTWVKEMLRRSKEAGLVIDVNIDDRSPECVLGLRLALEHSHRIEHLSVYNEAGQWPELLPMLRKSIPQLQSLCLSSSYGIRTLHGGLLGPLHAGLVYPKPIFSSEDIPNESPKLRSLELNYFTADWDSKSTFFHSLTYLKLHGTVPSPHLTWEWFVDVLKGAPRLEVLDLKDSFPACPDEHITYGSAHLGFLQNLVVCCEPEEGEIFFYCITLPSTTIVTVDCCVNLHDMSSTAGVNFSGMFIGLAHLYSNMESAPDFQTLTLLQPSLPLPGARLQLLTEYFTHQQMPSHNDPPALLDVTYTWPSRYSLEDAATKSANDMFSSGLPLRNISHVYLMEEIDGFGAETLARTVGELIQVRSIVTTMSTRRMLVDALRLDSHNVDAQSGIPSETTYFPNLTSIHFCESKFTNCDDEEDSDENDEDEDEDKDEEDKWDEEDEDEDGDEDEDEDESEESDTT